jgi:RNA polymerase sigma-70 factor (ECF subfamily)
MFDFETLYRTYASEVYRFSFWLAGESREAEDITTETFIRAWTNSKPPRTETLKAYLFVIARNLFLEQKRKAKRQVALEEHHPDPAPSPEKVVESRMQLQEVARNLHTFPEIDQTAFILRVQHDFPYAEIARVLGISTSSAKVKVHRVRKKLFRRFLKEEDS